MARRGVAATSILACLALAAAAIAGCGDEPDERPRDPTQRLGSNGDDPYDEDLTGRVDLAAPRILVPMLKSAGQNLALETSVAATTSTATDEQAIDRLCAAEVEYAGSLRELRPSERRVCRRNDIDVASAPVAHLAVGVAASEDLGARCLTVAELRRLWRAGSDVRSLSQLDPGLSDARLTLIGSRSDMAAQRALPDMLGVAGLRGDYRGVEEVAVFERLMRERAPALGFLNFAQLRPLPTPGLRALAIDAGDGCVRPAVATIRDGSYGTLSRPLYLHASRSALGRSPAARAYADSLFDDYEESVKAARLVVPLSQARVERSQRQLTGRNDDGGRR